MSRVLAVVLLVLVAAGCADEPVTPPAPSPDAAFVAGMVPHHQQALELTAMVGGRGASPGLEAVALRIDRDQVEEIGQLQGLALARGLPVVPAPMMMGMASPATLAALPGLRGAAFERLWLDTMIRHHEGALAMARDYLATGTDETLRRYNQALIASQSAEITTMAQLRTTIAGP
ncbi:DUF305 domain-containing protein [Actinomycetospora sp. NBRC 106375]|uniref:DUF305 domain-containing protein n=1 Tax=Actinomycetospora sp. NBRC 106375 TaxID=3032207 RepID=UPI0025546435|nr:DUF305 domain-containing protein [Actinomycetospora sp. NBRC 106375]